MEEEMNCFHEASFTDKGGNIQTLKVPVVQELARHGHHHHNHLPEMFLRSPNELPITSSTQYPIPIINVANLLCDSEPMVRTQELAKLAKGAKELCLFQVVNHGICLRSLNEVIKGFFDLSFQEKKESVGSYRSTDNIGYGRNFVKSDDRSVDWIDRIAMRVAPRTVTDGLDVWPRKPVNFRQVMETYVEEGRRVLDELLQALAESLGLNRECFHQYFEPAQSVVNIRVNYYPPCPRPKEVLGITPHSDASALTLLGQFGSTGGLQVVKENEWVTVEWPRDTLIVLAGDFLEIISDGRIQSPWHRVVTQEDKERFSVAMFYNPPLQTEIEPVRDSHSIGFGYKKVVMEDYLENYYKISPTKDKQAILFAKV